MKGNEMANQSDDLHDNQAGGNVLFTELLHF